MVTKILKMVGREWVEDFLPRNPMISSRKAQIIILEDPRNGTATFLMTMLQNFR
jgi:hypothetical protein